MIATHQVGQALIAASQLFALPFERSFSPAPYVAFADSHWPLCLSLVAGYLAVIFLGRRLMRDRAPFELRLPLALWNAALSLFSFIGMWRTMPYLLGTVLTKSYDCTVCDDGIATWAAGPSGLWVMLFIYSKIPELIDTIFIVLRKKPLIFLHWYHHITVLMFCWSAYSTMAASGLYFVAMNFTVHALMYGYYCLQALNLCPKSFPAYLITLSQIAQMFIGTGVCISCWYYLLQGKTCHNDFNNLVAGALMYGSYLYLFCEFAVKRYIFPQKSKKGVEKKIE